MKTIKIKKSEMDAMRKMTPEERISFLHHRWDDPFTTVEITDEEGNVIYTIPETGLVASYDTRPKGGVYKII